MIPQTNNKSMTANPAVCRIFTANTLRTPPLLQNACPVDGLSTNTL